MPAIDSGRVRRSYTQRIEAPPEAVFPLLCPVREGEWLDGWSETVEMIHADSGLAEEGCVFRTRVPGRPETVWMITRHDPAARVVEFWRVTTGLLATRLRVGVEPFGAEASSVRIDYVFTPLGAEGREFIASNHSAERFEADMEWWERSMNRWLASGERLREAAG